MTALIAELNRRYLVNGWFLSTNGKCAVLRPLFAAGDVDPTAEPAGPKMLEAVTAWLAAELPSLDIRPLLALIDPPACDECKGRRMKVCPYCNGSAKRERECEHCNDTHHCVCEGCTDGYLACRCIAPEPVVVCKLALNRWLVSALISHMVLEPAAPVRLGRCDVPGGVALLLRQGDTLGVAMPMLFDDDALQAAPVFPATE